MQRYMEHSIPISLIAKWGVFLLCLFVSAYARAQENLHPILRNDTVVFTGIVKSKKDQQPLIGANIKIKGNPNGAVTDVDGAFRIRLTVGKHQIEISYLGYETQRFNIEIFNTSSYTFFLEESVNLLETVEVSDQGVDRNVRSTDISVSRLSVQSIKALPSLLGEADVIRGLQTLPGVTTVGEGATGFNVRGGSIDQNWVLLDDIPLFNTSHLLGLFSVFNPDVVRDVIFYRGGIPATYGGRSSSVLDVRLRDPARDAWKIRGGVGLVSQRLTAEGPIAGKSLTMSIAGRAAFPQYLFSLLADDRLRSTQAGYYDVTGKIKWQPTEHDQLALTAYVSGDLFKMAGDSLTGLEVNASSTQFRWYSEGAGLRWSHFFSPRWSAAVVGAISNYRPKFSIPDDAYAATYRSGIYYQNGKLEVNHYGDNHEVAAGFSLSNYRIQPGDLQPDNALSAINPVTLQEEQALEAAAYINDQWNISERLSLMLGLRYVQFVNRGSGQVYTYAPGEPRDVLTRVDTIFYGKGETIAQYGGFEPRLALRWSLSGQSAIKIGLNRMAQYVTLISNTTAALPTDRWKLSDQYVKPQVSDQAAIGYFYNSKDNAIETSVEFFYKKQKNAPDFRSGTSLLLLETPETAILQGDGRAYGVELMIRKAKGRLNGWVSYTYSQAELLINSPYPEDEAFSGDYYPANFNRPHMLNIAANYRHSAKVSYAANFVFTSGRPATFPVDKYYVGGVYVPNYVSRNLDLIPAYHRLDLSMTIEPPRKEGRKGQGRWQISLYNVYARKNAFSIFFKTRNSSPIRANNSVEAYRLSVLGTIIPAISYEFQF